MDDQVLCQDCMKVKGYTEKRHSGEELCECGGEFCGCAGCSETIRLLVAGKRDAVELGLQADIKIWNPETGIY